MSNLMENAGSAIGFREDDLIPISALQHFEFCPRQCALIHIERLWQENFLTAEGRVLHEHVHERNSETRSNIRIVRSLKIRSLKLGLAGVADLVEFVSDKEGVFVPGLSGRWRPHPVEYKRGRPKPGLCDEVQLCAQALCLEEMLNAKLESGDIFYGQPHRRHHVIFNRDLREETERATVLARRLILSGITPPAEFGPKCRSCSMYDYCLPKTVGRNKSARRYISQMLSS